MVNGFDKIQGFGKELDVLADPNYHFSPAGWSGGGSPWTQNGDWTAEYGGGVGQGIPTDSDFLGQWAFSEAGGIHLFDAAGNRITGGLTGDGTHIAIFDTSPFSDTHVPGGECENCTLLQLGMAAQSIPPAFADMRLTVMHFPLEAAPTCPGWDRSYDPDDPDFDPDDPKYSLEDQDISNHGLFVASLAHTVAPSSRLYLVRVLENDGCGSLVTIEEGISRFISRMEAERGSDDLGGIILNLSLGVHEPPNAKDSFKLPPEVETLSQTLHSAIEANAVVVAAAGNDSFTSTVPLEMEIPARNDGVIGVAASNSERTRACFSNADSDPDALKFAAPGGHGVRGEYQYLGVVSQTECAVPKIADCENSADSPCVIGLVAKGKPGYAYWFGTSFSAPLISGAAALVIEKEGTIDPPHVAAAIAVGSCSASGVAEPIQISNLPKTMNLTPSCPP
jgi:subtilisin family serine protease